MTTLAIDTNSIAWDTQITYGNEKMISKAKKVRVVAGVIFGLTGDYGRYEALIAWWHNGAEDTKVPKGSWDFLVIQSPQKMTLYGPSTPAGISMVPPFALGTGDQFAIGRLDAPGATAQDAVRSSMKHDIYTGGSLKTLRFDRVWGKGKKRSKSTQK